MEKLEGLIPPLITPFDKKGNPDLKALENIVEFIKDYIHGVFLCGTYGQGPIMSIEEKKIVIKKVVSMLNNSKKIVVHVGCANPYQAYELAKYAEDQGADVIASVPPFYYRYSEESVIHYFKELVSKVDIPVYVYNNPSRVGYPVTLSLLRKLEEIGVKGVKDSSFDLINFTTFNLYTSDDFDVVIGTEALILPGYVLGARAFIAGMSNYLPEIVYQLYESCRKGDYKKASELQYRVNKVRHELHELYQTIPLSYVILKLRGVDAGFPRKPFIYPGEKIISRVREVLVKEDLL